VAGLSELRSGVGSVGYDRCRKHTLPEARQEEINCGNRLGRRLGRVNATTATFDQGE